MFIFFLLSLFFSQGVNGPKFEFLLNHFTKLTSCNILLSDVLNKKIRVFERLITKRYTVELLFLWDTRCHGVMDCW